MPDRHAGTRFYPPRSLLIVVILTLLILAPPCPAAESSGKMEITVGIETIRGFDAVKAIPTISTSIAANAIMEPLFYMDDKGDLVPALGLTAVPSEDGKSWTVTLRRNVKYHDDAPFNADAVVAHYTRILDPKNRYRGRMYITPIMAVEKMDSHTVRFKLKHPWPAFKAALSWNRSYTSLIPSPVAVGNDTQNASPSGTGPFRFVEWKRSDSIIVEKNPNYWDPGKPVADRIVFRIIPDHQTRYAALGAGELDFMYTDRGSHIVQAQKDDTLNVFTADDNGAEIIVLNNAKPPLDDVRVRKALVHAWDQARYISMSYKDTIPMVKNVFGGRVECPDSAYLEYDPKAAKALLAEYGRPVKIEYLHTDSKRGRDAGQIFQQMCKAVGIELILTPLDIGPIVQKVVKGDYQVSSWRIPSSPDPGPILFAQYHSKSPADYSNYADPEMDDLLEKQRRATAPDVRRDLLCRIAAKINSDAVTIFRGGRRYHFIAPKDLKGLDRIIQGVPLLHTVSRDR